jgi:hypothetical protein
VYGQLVFLLWMKPTNKMRFYVAANTESEFIASFVSNDTSMTDASNHRPRMFGLLLRAETWIFLGIWLTLMVVGRTRLFQDPDTLWHIVTGARILSTHHLPETDSYSFTFFDRPWTPVGWLGECVMAALHAVGGLDSLLLATATALAGLYAWLAHRLIRQGLHWMPALLVVVLAIGAGAGGFHARPHIATMVFMGLTFALLVDFEAGRVGVGRLFALIPLFLVWTNWHGGMLGGLATMGLFTAGWGLGRMIGWNAAPARRGETRYLVLLVLACGLTALVNPYGMRLPQTWLRIMTSPVIPRIIVEHRPPSPTSADFWLILLLGLAYLAALAGTFPRKPRVVWLIPLVWMALALSRVRHAPLFGITAVLALTDLLPGSRLSAWLARPGRDLFRSPEPDRPAHPGPTWRPVVFPLVIFVAVFGLQATGLRAPLVGRGWVQLDPRLWPTELLPELRAEERAAGGNGRIFNASAYGGFLIYHTPGLKVFIDGRCELYGDEWLMDYYAASQGDPRRIEGWAERYGFTLALVQSGSLFDRYLSDAPGWGLIRRNGTAALYRRVAGKVDSRGAL